MATRPNVTPIVVTTGVGPNGRQTIYYQDPNEDSGTSGVFDPPPERQYQTLLAALQGEAAHREQQPANPTPADILDQENQPLAATPSTPKTLAATLLLKAKASICKVVPKLTLEETLINMQKYVLFNLFLLSSNNGCC
jgi:hypothetical protein